MNKQSQRKQNQRIRKLKKKISKINYLNEELDDVIQTVDEYSHEFREAITSWCTAHHANDALVDIFPTKTEDELIELAENNKDDDLILNKKIDKWAKEIYRQIANETHPDKVSQRKNLNEKKESELHEAFILANNALKECDGPLLYIIALNLNLKMKNIPDDILEHFDKSIDSLNKKIDSNKNTHVWHWAESSFNERKIIIGIQG